MSNMLLHDLTWSTRQVFIKMILFTVTSINLVKKTPLPIPIKGRLLGMIVAEKHPNSPSNLATQDGCGSQLSMELHFGTRLLLCTVKGGGE